MLRPLVILLAVEKASKLPRTAGNWPKGSLVAPLFEAIRFMELSRGRPMTLCLSALR